MQISWYYFRVGSWGNNGIIMCHLIWIWITRCFSVFLILSQSCGCSVCLNVHHNEQFITPFSYKLNFQRISYLCLKKRHISPFFFLFCSTMQHCGLSVAQQQTCASEASCTIISSGGVISLHLVLQSIISSDQGGRLNLLSQRASWSTLCISAFFKCELGFASFQLPLWINVAWCLHSQHYRLAHSLTCAHTHTLSHTNTLTHHFPPQTELLLWCGDQRLQYLQVVLGCNLLLVWFWWDHSPSSLYLSVRLFIYLFKSNLLFLITASLMSSPWWN